MDHKRKTDFTMPYKSSGIIISGTQYDAGRSSLLFRRLKFSTVT